MAQIIKPKLLPGNNLAKPSFSMRGFTPRSISRALTLSLVLTITMVALSGIVPMYFYQKNKADTDIKDKADAYLSHLVDALEAPLWHIDTIAINEIGENISKDESIVYLLIKGDDGREIYSYKEKTDVERIKRSSKIFHQGELAGYIEFALTKEQYQKKRRNLLLLFCVGTLLILIALALVTGLFVRHFLNKPLYALNKIVESYAQAHYDSAAAELPYSEFQPLGRVLAQMGATIKEQLTSLRKLNKELLQSREEAEKANRAKSAFLANMSHELRTPLNVIMGYSQLMQKNALSPAEQRGYIDTISRSSEHLLALINEVLEISKIEAGQLTFESTTFDLPALFGDLEKEFSSSLDDKGLSFKVIGIDDLPRYVSTDENKLHQVLVNILGNAVKFTEQGGITMRVTAKDETADAMRLAVEVQDTGIGIAEDEQDKVFAYLEQTASGRAQKSGTGLGLAISRDYVRLMGGEITVTSKEGKGSAFCFEIDVKKGRKADLKARVPKLRVKGLQPGEKVPRVLVAEDKSDSRILLSKILKTAGFDVEEAVNGKEAVDIFQKWQPDFIWMDIRMPVMDGLEATRCIKETAAGRSTVVAALTAHALEEEKEPILAAGCDDFVRKPFREQEIFEVMAKHLGLKYVYEENPAEPDAGVEIQAQVTPEQLAALPADIRNRLHQAAVELNESKCLKIIEQIKAHDADMAGVLKFIVNQLEFHRLLDLLQGRQYKPGGGP